ncbi:hypothetical protein BHM03_00006091 [Ensete ventricosum]|nr:hypothetical protein BHM03_00006091 [Ensete ventricosum]
MIATAQVGACQMPEEVVGGGDGGTRSGPPAWVGSPPSTAGGVAIDLNPHRPIRRRQPIRFQEHGGGAALRVRPLAHRWHPATHDHHWFEGGMERWLAIYEKPLAG